jgi:protein-disulfide isomerase
MIGSPLGSDSSRGSLRGARQNRTRRCGAVLAVVAVLALLAGSVIAAEEAATESATQSAEEAATEEGGRERTPLAEVHGDTLYVEDVEGALAFRIYKLQLDIYSLLKSEAEARIEERLLAQEAQARSTTVEALLASVAGEAAAVSDEEVDLYLAEHPPVGERDPEQARLRVRHYLVERARLERRVAFMEALREKAGTKILLAAPTPPRTEVDVAGAPARGPESAAVEIVHFASFGSRNSARSAGKIERLRTAFPGEIRQVHRNLLNDRDEVGLAGARIAFVAAESGRFWEIHDRIFADDSKMPSVELIEAYAVELGIPAESARSARVDPARLQAVKRDIESAHAAGAPREPSLFINGRFVSGLLPYDDIKKIVEEEIRSAVISPP